MRLLRWSRQPSQTSRRRRGLRDKDAEAKRLCVFQRKVNGAPAGHGEGEEVHSGMHTEGNAFVTVCDAAVKSALGL